MGGRKPRLLRERVFLLLGQPGLAPEILTMERRTFGVQEKLGGIAD